MNHQFHHPMTHSETPPPKKKQQQKIFQVQHSKLGASRLPDINLTSFALLLPPLLENPASSAHPAAAGVWLLPCLCPGLVRCGGCEQYGHHCACPVPGLQRRSSCCCCWLAHWDPQFWAQYRFQCSNNWCPIFQYNIPKLAITGQKTCLVELFPHIGAFSLPQTSLF